MNGRHPKFVRTEDIRKRQMLTNFHMVCTWSEHYKIVAGYTPINIIIEIKLWLL